MTADLDPELARIVGDLIDGLTVRPRGDDEFEGNTPTWHGDPLFGGAIIGQAMSAAVQTVGDDRLPHSIHAAFLRPVRVGELPRLRVERVRDGRTFTTRRVVIEQASKVAFDAIVSFHTGGELPPYQQRLADTVPRPGDLDPTPAHPEWGPGPFEERELGPTDPGPDGYRSSTSRMWMRLAAPGPDEPLLNAVVLAYATDITRTSGRPHRLEGDVSGMISLDHAAWFHRPVRADQWLYFDCHALVSAGGRTTIRGTMHTTDGDLAISMAQEMVILIP